MELIDDAGNPPNLYVHLDTYHMNIEESSSEFAVGVCGDKLGYAPTLLNSCLLPSSRIIFAKRSIDCSMCSPSVQVTCGGCS